MTGLFVAATHKSSGKTTFCMGLCAALRARGLVVQPFKKGPDYIDPAWLSDASGAPCINLDFYTLTHAELQRKYQTYASSAQFSIVEGNKGLFDGLAVDGSDSNAALARLLGVPVVLLVDCEGMTRGIAPLLLGYQQFAEGFSISGVVLNKVGGARHESKLRAAIEHYTDLPVFGALSKWNDLELPERHLGLVPSYEHDDARSVLEQLSGQVESQIDLARLLSLGAQSSAINQAAYDDDETGGVTTQPSVRIGLARDSAFGFYYPDDLAGLRRAGAQIVEFSPIADRHLPAVDALLIGGGFPETHLPELARNDTLHREICQFVERGHPVYAECGGLMYLARSLTRDGQTAPMVGALPIDVTMHERPQGRGYMKLAQTRHFPWPAAGDGAAVEIPAHEFHYSSLERIDASIEFGYRVKRGHGIDGDFDGIVHRRVLASYAHQRHTTSNPWASRFVAYVKESLARH